MVDLTRTKALTLDVFGTVVDWRSTIVRELRDAEYGPGQTANLEADPSVDVVASDFGDLADPLL